MTIPGERGPNRGRGRGRGRGNRGGYYRPAPSDLTATDFNEGSGEINADLSERFRGARLPRLNNTSSFEPTNDFVVNHDIRRYVHAQENITQEAQPGDWLSQLEIPSNDEIALSADAEVVLAANKIKGKWKNTDKYLRAHYALLREDAISPLRDAVDRYKKDPDMMDNHHLSIYEKVYIAGFTFSQLGIATRIRFSTTRACRNIMWSGSKRLTSGTLVALFPADDKLQQKCIVALVAARPLSGLVSNPPEIDLFFCRSEDMEIDPQQEWVMVEARTGYYEAYRHTLRALQKLSKEKFPLSEHICTMSPDIESPAYLKGDPVMNLESATTKDRGIRYENIDVLRDWPSTDESNLDETQWEALNQVLTKSLGIIQGPPGTGKTYVSTVALKILRRSLKEDEPPIIIAAQTNHALDQLLGHVSKFEPRYIRLGGRSTNAEIKKRALYEIRTAERIPRLPGGLLGQASNNHTIQAKAMIQILRPLHGNPQEPLSTEILLEYAIITKKQADSLGTEAARWISADGVESDPLKLWLDRALVPFRVVYQETPNFGVEEEDEDLEFEQLREHEAENGVSDEEDWELLKGPWCCVEEKWTVNTPVESDLELAAKELNRQQDLWKIKDGLRGAVYRLIQQRLKAKILAKFRQEAALYEKNLKDLKIGKWERDAVYLKRAKIIGLTTTGLSKYRPLIASLKPKIVLIEEAAEVLEAPITVACMESLEHLILVGDHLQLQGHCSVQELEGEPYYLNVSMFERLVRNGMPFKTLLRQRRMDPSFRQLISSLYPGLQDHQSVIDRKSPEWGMGAVRSFFFSHEWSEYRDSQMSIFNAEEARFVAGFYRYLHQNNIPVANITVLTFYNGQRKKILKEIRNFPELREAYNSVKTVDSYQGEENEIVILSLTRSTYDGKIGFLEIVNRVCVALSRAKFGFYIFGNGNTLLSSRNMLWNNVITHMRATKRYHNALPLFCQRHNKTAMVRYADDWNEINGGCKERCKYNLSCGHPCPLNCHPYTHDMVECGRDCMRKLVCGHECRNACSEPCDCNCEAFQQTPRGIEEKNTVTEGPAWNVSTMRNTLPTSDILYRKPQAEGVAPATAWSNGPPTTDRVLNGTLGQGHGFDNGKDSQMLGSASYLPVQTGNSTTGATRTGTSGHFAMPYGRVSHPAFQDQFAETTDSCTRWSLEEQAGKREGWDAFASGGVKADDERRELIRGEGGGYEVAKKDVKGRSRVLQESTRDVGGGRSRFEGEHVPAAWKDKESKQPEGWTWSQGTWNASGMR